MRSHFKNYPLKYLPARIAASLKAIAQLHYRHPSYLLVSFAVSVVFYEIIFWFLNLGLFQYLLTTPYITLLDKLGIVIGSYSGIFTQPYSALAITLFIVSLIQGMAVSSIIFSVRKERQARGDLVKGLGGTGIAGILSVLGLGCAACGTSLVTPILTFFFASSSIALAEKVGLISAILALVIAVITLYLAGLKLSAKLSFDQ